QLFSLHDYTMYKWDAPTSRQLGSSAPQLVSEGKLTPWGLTTPEGQALWTQQVGGGLLDDKLNLPKVVNGPFLGCNRSYLFSPDGKMLAVHHKATLRGKGEDKITLHEMPTGQLLHTIPTVAVGRLVFFPPNGKLLAAFADAKTLGVWDTTGGKRIA